jgi:hypothetical protein
MSHGSSCLRMSAGLACTYARMHTNRITHVSTSNALTSQSMLLVELCKCLECFLRPIMTLPAIDS